MNRRMILVGACCGLTGCSAPSPSSEVPKPLPDRALPAARDPRAPRFMGPRASLAAICAELPLAASINPVDREPDPDGPDHSESGPEAVARPVCVLDVHPFTGEALDPLPPALLRTGRWSSVQVIPIVEDQDDERSCLLAVRTTAGWFGWRANDAHCGRPVRGTVSHGGSLQLADVVAGGDSELVVTLGRDHSCGGERCGGSDLYLCGLQLDGVPRCSAAVDLERGSAITGWFERRWRLEPGGLVIQPYPTEIYDALRDHCPDTAICDRGIPPRTAVRIEGY